MTDYAIFQGHVVDSHGEAQNGATITVRREVAGQPLATIYSIRDGSASPGNPFVIADATGYFAFYAAGGAYQITATLGAFTRTWRYVAIGRGAEADAFSPSITVDNTIPRFDGVTGSLQGSGIVITDGNILDFGILAGTQEILLYSGGLLRYGFGISAAELRVFTDSTAGTHIVWGNISTADASTFTGVMRLDSGAAPYIFKPVTNDGVALGSASLSWSDLFLAAGGVINWNNGDVTITHSTNLLAFAGAASGYTFDAVIDFLQIGLGQRILLYHNVNLRFGFGIGAAELQTFTDDTNNSFMTWGKIANADGTTYTGVMRLDISATPVLKPVANDGVALGAATLSWSDLFLASGGVINWNNSAMTLTHSVVGGQQRLSLSTAEFVMGAQRAFFPAGIWFNAPGGTNAGLNFIGNLLGTNWDFYHITAGGTVFAIEGSANASFSGAPGSRAWPRVDTDFVVTNTTALANITSVGGAGTGLIANLLAASTYHFEIHLSVVTGNIAQGYRAAVAVSQTPVDIRYDGYGVDTNTIKGQAVGAASAAVVANFTPVATTVTVIIIRGTITTHATLDSAMTVQFAQSVAAGGITSTVKRGSWMRVWKALV